MALRLSSSRMTLARVISRAAMGGGEGGGKEICWLRTDIAWICADETRPWPRKTDLRGERRDRQRTIPLQRRVCTTAPPSEAASHPKNQPNRPRRHAGTPGGGNHRWFHARAHERRKGRGANCATIWFTSSERKTTPAIGGRRRSCVDTLL